MCFQCIFLSGCEGKLETWKACDRIQALPALECKSALIFTLTMLFFGGKKRF